MQILCLKTFTSKQYEIHWDEDETVILVKVLQITKLKHEVMNILGFHPHLISLHLLISTLSTKKSVTDYYFSSQFVHNLQRDVLDIHRVHLYVSRLQ